MCDECSANPPFCRRAVERRAQSQACCRLDSPVALASAPAFASFTSHGGPFELFSVPLAPIPRTLQSEAVGGPAKTRTFPVYRYRVTLPLRPDRFALLPPLGVEVVANPDRYQHSSSCRRKRGRPRLREICVPADLGPLPPPPSLSPSFTTNETSALPFSSPEKKVFERRALRLADPASTPRGQPLRRSPGWSSPSSFFQPLPPGRTP